jgi:hypothetical protein
MTALGNVKKSETSDFPADDRSDAERIFDEFCADRESIAALNVTAEEFRELSRASLFGTLTSKDDLLFMLRQIRAAMNPTAAPTIEQSTKDVNQLAAETMRLAALAKLDELDLKAAKRRESVVGRVEAALEIVSLVLNIMFIRAQSFAVHLSRKLNRRAVNSRPV